MVVENPIITADILNELMFGRRPILPIYTVFESAREEIRVFETCKRVPTGSPRKDCVN